MIRRYGGNGSLTQEMYLRVPKEFTDKFPDMPIEKAQKHYDTYINALKQLLLKRLPFVRGNYIHVSLNKLWYYEFNYKNKRYYIYQEFKDIRPFFSVLEHKKGNGRKSGNKFELNSEVFIMNQKLLDFLIDSSDAEQLVKLYYGDLTDDVVNSIEVIPIDIDSLTNFINSTKQEIQKSEKNSVHQAALYKNLRQAKYVKVISEYFYPVYNKHVLPQIPQRSDYGRMYYKGINIQNMDKIVRKACLGSHYTYDLNAAVYAIKLMICKQILREHDIDDTEHFTYTKQYLEFKDTLRKQLSKHITAYSDGLKLIKQAITAIGFGARIGGGSWLVDGEWHHSSIEDIIMNKTDRENFMNDPFIKKFVKEQQAMTKIISDYFTQQPEFMEKIAHIPNMFNHGKVRRSQVVSYVFQHTEYDIMNIITENLPVICRIHDSFITKEKLTNDQILEVKYQLNKFEPLMTINYEYENEFINTYDNDDESDIDEAFSKLTGVDHTRPKVTIKHKATKSTPEGFYGDKCDWGQQEYDPNNDPYVADMTPEQLNEHYRIIGYKPSILPQHIEKLL